MADTRFSIIMPNYNKAPYIGEAVQSVINQIYPDWELIIVDDGSTDDSIKEITPFLDNPSISLKKHNENRGRAHALHSGIEESSNTIIAVLDSDDTIVPHSLETMAKAYEEHPDCGFIYSQFISCNPELKPVSRGFCRKIPKGLTSLECNCVSAFKTFKKDDYYKTEGYDQEMEGAIDKDIIMKMEEVTRLFFVNEPLYNFRVLPDSVSHDPAKAALRKQNFIKARKAAKERRKGQQKSLMFWIRFFRYKVITSVKIALVGIFPFLKR